ncbi:MAG TPA: hypothetical protein VF669_02880 [Tepidisphaeraceae bacterium]|jgi:hypothetical protein
MPCLIVLFSLAAPRLILILVAIFSNYLHRAYHTWLWPILGFFFAPLTTLAYAYAVNTNGSVNGWYLGLVIVAAIFDFSSLGSGGRHAGRRRRRRR